MPALDCPPRLRLFQTTVICDFCHLLLNLILTEMLNQISLGNTQQRKVDQIPSLWFSNVLLCCVVFVCVCSTTGHYYYFSKKWN